MCEPITFLPLADRNVDLHLSLNLSNNWLQKLDRANQGDEVATLSPLCELTLRPFSKAVQSFVKLIHTMNKNNTFVDFAFYIEFPYLIWVMSSATSIDLARKRKLGP